MASSGLIARVLKKHGQQLQAKWRNDLTAMSAVATKAESAQMSWKNRGPVSAIAGRGCRE